MLHHQLANVSGSPEHLLLLLIQTRSMNLPIRTQLCALIWEGILIINPISFPALAGPPGRCFYSSIIAQL